MRTAVSGARCSIAREVGVVPRCAVPLGRERWPVVPTVLILMSRTNRSVPLHRYTGMTRQLSRSGKYSVSPRGVLSGAGTMWPLLRGVSGANAMGTLVMRGEKRTPRPTASVRAISSVAPVSLHASIAERRCGRENPSVSASMYSTWTVAQCPASQLCTAARCSSRA
jgi:hypothetical protein